MARRLFTLLSALSLLLCAAVVVLWVRSYRVGDAWTWWAWRPQEPDPYRMLYVRSGEGRVAVGRVARVVPPGRATYDRPPDEPLNTFQRQSHPSLKDLDHTVLGDPPHTTWGRLGFYYAPFHRRQLRDVILVVPYWFLLVVALILPARWVKSGRRGRARRRRERGLCSSCGYDLRATPGRCPECGLAPSKLGRGG